VNHLPRAGSWLARPELISGIGSRLAYRPRAGLVFAAVVGEGEEGKARDNEGIVSADEGRAWMWPRESPKSRCLIKPLMQSRRPGPRLRRQMQPPVRYLTRRIRVGDDRPVSFEVVFQNVAGEAAAIGSAGPYTLVVDRPADAGGRGLGFNGGQLLYLAIGGCVSNDLFREATVRGIQLTTVRVLVCGDFSGEPAVSEDISYEVEVAGDASPEQLEELVSYVDAIAEIPNSVRRGTQVRLSGVRVAG